MSLDDAAKEFRSKLSLFTLLFIAPVLAFAVRGLLAWAKLRRWLRNVR